MNQRMDAGTYIIRWDDIRHRIEVNGYAMKLSPTQSRIFQAFAASIPSKVPIADEIVVLAYRSYRTLETETSLSHRLLVRHISHLNARTMALELQLCSFRAGYLLIFPASSARNAQQGEQGRHRKGNVS